MKKNRYLSLIAGMLWLLTCQANALTNQAAADDLAILLGNFHALTANFEQKTYDANTKALIQNSSGSMALSRPGKFRWDVTQPTVQLLIADGRYLWIYDADLAQVTRQKFDKDKVNSPAFLLSGSVEQLKSRFEVVRLTPGSQQSFRLTPKSSGDLFAWIEVSFVDKKLTRMRLLDNLGSLSVFHFAHVVVDPLLNANLFQFKVPPGVDVVQNS